MCRDKAIKVQTLKPSSMAFKLHFMHLKSLLFHPYIWPHTTYIWIKTVNFQIADNCIVGIQPSNKISKLLWYWVLMSQSNPGEIEPALKQQLFDLQTWQLSQEPNVGHAQSEIITCSHHTQHSNHNQHKS